MHKEPSRASFCSFKKKRNCSIFGRVVEAKVGWASVGLPAADLLADPGKLLLPDSLDLLFANVLCFRADTKPTEDLILPDTLRKGHAVILLGTTGTFGAPTRERRCPCELAADRRSGQRNEANSLQYACEVTKFATRHGCERVRLVTREDCTVESVQLGHLDACLGRRQRIWR